MGGPDKTSSSTRPSTSVSVERPGVRPSREEGSKDGARHRTLRDAYRATRHSSELIKRVMTPQIVGRGFEVGAMKEHHGRPARESGREPHRILRDGRLILGTGTGKGKADPSEQGQSVKPGRSLQAEQAKSVFAPAKSVSAGAAAESPEAPETSLFEKIFLAHFEGEIPIVSEMLGKGEFKFLPKTQKGWIEFFQKFAAFALLKAVEAGDIQSLIFRGLMGADGTLTKEGKALLAQSKAVLVSDLKFMDGKTDKFARLAISPSSSNDPLLQIFSKMLPGDVITPEMFAELVKAMGGEEFSYLALSHKIVNPDMVKTDPSAATQAYQTPEKMREIAMREGTREATPGIALSAKTEQLMAEHLDIDLKSSRSEIGLDRRAGETGGMPPPMPMSGLFGKKKKRSSLWGGSGDEDFAGSVFVPWYQHLFRPQKFKGKPRWWVAFTYAIAGSVGLLAAYYLFKFWMH